jgi:hypothetical protein
MNFVRVLVDHFYSQTFNQIVRKDLWPLNIDVPGKNPVSNYLEFAILLKSAPNKRGT